MSCGSTIDVGQVANEVKDLVKLDEYAKKDGGVLSDVTIKGGITLNEEAKKALCDGLTTCIAGAISDAVGDSVVGDLAWDASTNKLSWTENGRAKSAVLEFIKGVVGSDGSAIITMPNGTHLTVPTTETMISKDMLGDGIVLDANVPGKLGVKVNVENPIKGDGTKANPLGIKLSEDFMVDANGDIALNNVHPKVLSSVVNYNYPYGLHTFSGEINNHAKTGTIGLPPSWNSSEDTATMTKTYEDYQGTQNYDFSGYYISTDKELTLWVTNDGKTWSISNDYGVNADGTLKNPNGFGPWRKLDNVPSISNEIITKMQTQLNGLAKEVAKANTAIQNNGVADEALKKRVKALEDLNEELCKVDFKEVSSYTLLDEDSTILATGGEITIPSNLSVGRTFTVIQKGTTDVVLKQGENSKLIPPFGATLTNGKLTLAGDNAAVTLIVSGNKEIRVIGQTK